MPLNHSLSNLTDQVAEILRDGMLSGRWRDSLPGRDQLAAELGVSHTTMEAAMRKLAMEGMLVSQGAGKRRRIVLPEDGPVPRHFRVCILLYELLDGTSPYISDMLDRLKSAGLTADLATKSLLDLGMEAKRVARFVEKNPADAWIVGAGSHEVLKWFCGQPVPVYAFYGVWTGLPIAGCGVKHDIPPLIERLTALGHRRIVLLAREENMLPQLSSLARDFVEALQRAGITAGSYNLPVWGYEPARLHYCLESLFQVARPTALITSEPQIMLAVRDHLTRRSIIAPRDVSLISLYHDPSFMWLDPLPTHYTFDYRPANRRIANWARNVSRGRQDLRQTKHMTRLVEGETVGPANLKPDTETSS